MNVITLGTGSSGNCYILESNNRYIILDCGLDFKTITRDKNFPKFRQIDFVFCSHIH